MKSLHLITVGKLKDKHLESLEYDYLKRIKNPKLTIHEVKASAEDATSEGLAVLKKVESIASDARIILLIEKGEEFESVGFAKWLSSMQDQFTNLVFVICGAEGPSQELQDRSDKKLSLSKLTFPHKIARVLLVEQIYRAQTILSGHPYHN